MHGAVKDKTTLYSTAPIIYIVAVVNKPQDMEQLNVKSTSIKYTKNWPQDTIGGVIVRRALTNKDQFQELPKKGIDL